MMINELKQRATFQNKRLNRTYPLFAKLLVELRKRELPDKIVLVINKDIDELNAIREPEKELRKQLAKRQVKILNLLEKELKIVPKNSYRNRWIGIGIALGIPFGTVFGTALGNMAFIGIGLPIGLAIGIAIGSEMDKKAIDEGRQLDIEIEL